MFNLIKLKKSMAVLIAFIMVLGLIVPVGAFAENDSGTISIVGTSDLHGNIYPLNYYTGKPADQGLAKVAAYVKGLKAVNPNIMLVDAGDTIQGTPLAYYYDKMDTTSEYPMIKAMSSITG